MPDILAIAGSARRGGNSDAVLGAAADALRQAGASVEVIVPSRLNVTPCAACKGCWKTGKCVLSDDLSGLYLRFEEADHIVVAAPLYFTSLPGHTKVLFDRFQPYWVRTAILEQPLERRRTGMFLCVAAMDKERYFRSTLTIVKSWMWSLNMGCEIARFYPGVDDRADLVTHHPDYLADARKAAEELLAVGA
jgi:multimeric flavodoxin WrbA